MDSMTHTLTPSGNDSTGNDSTGKEWGARIPLCKSLTMADSRMYYMDKPDSDPTVSATLRFTFTYPIINSRAVSRLLLVACQAPEVAGTARCI